METKETVHKYHVFVPEKKMKEIMVLFQYRKIDIVKHPLGTISRTQQVDFRITEKTKNLLQEGLEKLKINLIPALK